MWCAGVGSRRHHDDLLSVQVDQFLQQARDARRPVAQPVYSPRQYASAANLTSLGSLASGTASAPATIAGRYSRATPARSNISARRSSAASLVGRRMRPGRRDSSTSAKIRSRWASRSWTPITSSQSQAARGSRRRARGSAGPARAGPVVSVAPRHEEVPQDPPAVVHNFIG